MKTELDKNEMLQLLFLKKLKPSTEQESPPIANVLLAVVILSIVNKFVIPLLTFFSFVV